MPRHAQHREPQADAAGSIVVLTTDGQGVPMCPEALRPQTRKAAEASTHQLRTPFSKGEKHHRERWATVASFSRIAPYVHRANELVGALAPVRKTRQERQEVIAEMFD